MHALLRIGALFLRTSQGAYAGFSMNQGQPDKSSFHDMLLVGMLTTSIVDMFHFWFVRWSLSSQHPKEIRQTRLPLPEFIVSLIIMGCKSNLLSVAIFDEFVLALLFWMMHVLV